MPTELFEAAGLEESVRGRGSTEQDRAKLVVEVGESLGGAPYLPRLANHTHIDIMKKHIYATCTQAHVNMHTCIHTHKYMHTCTHTCTYYTYTIHAYTIHTTCIHTHTHNIHNMHTHT